MTEFEALDAEVIGVSADDPTTCGEFRARLRVPFTFVSDPQLQTAEALDVPTCNGACFAATLTLHPTLLRYPKKAFLQPALFVWTGATAAPAYEWRQTSTLRNLFGARGRPSGDDVLAIVRDVLRTRVS